MTWFEELTGFREESPEQVRTQLSVEGNILRCCANGREFIYGELEVPALSGLRQSVRSGTHPAGGISLRELAADVKDLHLDTSNAGALFQAASQFNLLEMISPDATPEDGVGMYEDDPTQGPACAIAAGAGTIYRNYFVPVNGQTGQSETNQIDCLADVSEALGNTNGRLWTMKNGYAWPSKKGLVEITAYLRSLDADEIDALRGKLRIGIQWETQVTISRSTHTVTQAYCSALPLLYVGYDPDLWKEFACLVLEAAYEATFCAAVLNAARTGNNRLFLTRVGGGAFGNDPEWIDRAIKRAEELYSGYDLDIVHVSLPGLN
jgi:hypothetical protein